MKIPKKWQIPLSGSGSDSEERNRSGSGSGAWIEVDPDPAKCSGSMWIRIRIRNAAVFLKLFFENTPIIVSKLLSDAENLCMTFSHHSDLRPCTILLQPI